MTSSGDDNRPSGSLGLLTDKTKKNKTFNKRKNRALLTLRRSQKHYEIFIIALSDEYIFGYVQRVLTSAEVFFFPRKLNPCFWRGKHELIYYRKGIPVNTTLLSTLAHSIADARCNTFITALNIPFESEQASKRKIQLNSG